jgi:DedD protein
MAWGILILVKERLTGAIVLVALMVLLVPELLTGPVGTKSAPVAAPTAAFTPASPPGAAALDQAPLRTYTLSLGAPASEATTAPARPPAQGGAPPPQAEQPPAPQSVPPGPPAAVPARAPAGAATRHHRVPTATPTPGAAAPAPRGGAQTGEALQAAKPPTHQAVREASSAASTRGWVVQLGSFADHGNASRLARSLSAKGFRMSVSRARAGSRVLWRVRAGPARDRAGARRLAARLRALGHRGEILPIS